jgi:DNA-binding transcriptional LysR family regulator
MKHELRQVRAFLKVAQLQSFTRAAAELHISQSALTVQIKQLEEELGVLLFDRNKRGVTITAAGRDLLGPLERLLYDTEAIVDYARDISALKTGLVTVAALPTIAADLLPRTIEEYRRLHPGVRIVVQDVVADRVRELVVNRAVDLGIGTAAKRDREITAKPLFHDFLAAFVPVTHPLAQLDEVSLRELLQHALILPNQESSVRRMVEAAAARDRGDLNLLQETNSMPTALAMVRRGLGITILPESAADWSRGDLVRIPIRKPVLSRQICLLQRRDRTLSPAAATFVQCLRRQVGSQAKAR